MPDSRLELTKVAGNIGVIVHNIDLSSDLEKKTIKAIRSALVTHKVLFFRDQHALDPDGQERFARRFGTPGTTGHPSLRHAGAGGTPALLELDYASTEVRTDFWHADGSYIHRPPLGTVLRAVTLPPYGGDTMWANCASAYADLPDELRAMADETWAIHATTDDGAPVRTTEDSPAIEAVRASFISQQFAAKHPLVRVHPESGERSLMLGRFFHRFVGWHIEMSRIMYQLLQSYCTMPEHVVRWHWEKGDVAFWDNRSTQHYALRDYGTHDRKMHRLTIAGDIPVSVAGVQSQPLSGDDTVHSTSLARPGDGMG